jgi:hypothetical protein
MRQGGDPRLPLELALVKVTRPGSDLSQESLAYRLELLERRAPSGRVHAPDPPASDAEADPEPEESTADTAKDEPEPPQLELQQLQEAWSRAVLEAVEARSIPVASMLREAHPIALEGDRLTVEFAGEADFHRKLAEQPKNSAIIRDALYDVTGRKLAVEFTLGERSGADDEPETHNEKDFVALFKETFDAREVEE